MSSMLVYWIGFATTIIVGFVGTFARRAKRGFSYGTALMLFAYLVFLATIWPAALAAWLAYGAGRLVALERRRTVQQR